MPALPCIRIEAEPARSVLPGWRCCATCTRYGRYVEWCYSATKAMLRGESLGRMGRRCPDWRPRRVTP